MTLFWLSLVLFIIVGTYCLEAVTSLLNLGALNQPLPPPFHDVIDQEDYDKSQAYTRASTRFSLFQQTVLLGLTIAFLLAGGFSFLDTFAKTLVNDTIGTGLVFIGSLLFLLGLINLPFSLYSTFVLEERFGFNKTTFTTFLLDRLKIVFLTLLLGTPLLSLILWFFESTGSMAWVYCWLGVSLFSIVLQFIAPALIMPLFNTFTPIADETLKRTITTYCEGESFQLQGIYTMDGSTRSTKLNAFFTGFGRFKKIVFYDTLLQKLSNEEILAVLAHEMGHYKHRHLHKLLVLGILQSALLFYLLSLVLGNVPLAQAFALKHPSTYTSLVIFSFLYTPISLVLSSAVHCLSRHYEFQADAYANRNKANTKAMIQALKKLSKENLSNLTPHPLYVLLHYSHPPVLERIRMLHNQ